MVKKILFASAFFLVFSISFAVIFWSKPIDPARAGEACVFKNDECCLGVACKSYKNIVRCSNGNQIKFTGCNASCMPTWNCNNAAQAQAKKQTLTQTTGTAKKCVQKGESCCLGTKCVYSNLVCRSGYRYSFVGCNSDCSAKAKCTNLKDLKCAGEGKALSKDAPICCGALSVYPINTVKGMSNICYSASKGKPVCKNAGKKNEGWYYSKTGKLLMPGKCAKKKTTGSSNKACPKVNKPVCAGDGKTYPNRCEAEKKGLKVYYEGQCEGA